MPAKPFLKLRSTFSEQGGSGFRLPLGTARSRRLQPALGTNCDIFESQFFPGFLFSCAFSTKGLSAFLKNAPGHRNARQR